MGIFLPFFPVYLSSVGLQATEISTILAAPLIMRILTAKLSGALADRLQERKIVLILSAFLAAILLGGLLLTTSFYAILILIALASIFTSALMPTIDALVMVFVRRHDYDFGRIRLWGSLSFILAAIGAGYVAEYFGAIHILLLVIGSYALVGLIALSLPRHYGHQDRSVDGADESKTAEGLRAFLTPGLISLLIASSLVQASHGYFYIFGNLYFLKVGIAATQTGYLWGIGVVAEILLFFIAKKWLPHAGGTVLILAGALAGLVRWSLFAVTSDLEIFYVLQILHGLTFGAVYLGTVTLIAKAVPERLAAQAQGAYVTLSSALTAVIVFSSGPVYEAISGLGYVAMALICAIALVLTLTSRKIETRDALK